MKEDENNRQNLGFHYQECEKDIRRLKEGIRLTNNVWNKYKTCIEQLIAGNEKAKEEAINKIRKRIKVLDDHWQDFTQAWNKFQFPKQSKSYQRDLFDPNADQVSNLPKLITKCFTVKEKKQFECFINKITDLHQDVQDFAYPHWFDRLYQFIKTTLLKLYNCLYSGPANLSGEKFYITAANYGDAEIKSHYVPAKHNYFICQEKLMNNTDVLQKDLSIIENWQESARLDQSIVKR